MYELDIEEKDYFDNKAEVFVKIPGQHLRLEHSLVAITKWESKWHEAFLSGRDKTAEQTFDYIRCMSLDPLVTPLIVYSISSSQLDKIFEYINEAMTASWVADTQSKKNSGVITSEVVYSMMFELGIPMECENWHLNRLIMQIKVGAERQKPQKKMSKQEIIARNRRLNEERRRKWHTNG